MESPVIHEKQACCIEPFDETDLQYLNSCFETTASLTTLERSALYYISVYVASKEDINVDNSEELTNSLDSEFTALVSRGKLRHPPNYMYDLSLHLYTYYKLSSKTCTEKLLKEFSEMLEVIDISFNNPKSVLRRYINCFSKGFSKKESERIVVDEKKKIHMKKKRKNAE